MFFQMLKAINDDEQHSAHAAVLLQQLVADTVEVLQQHGLFKPEQSKDLAKDLVYRICAVLDGSSFPGRLNGDEIAPFVGFYLRHSTEDALIPENGSGLHYAASDAVDLHFARKTGG